MLFPLLHTSPPLPQFFFLYFILSSIRILTLFLSYFPSQPSLPLSYSSLFLFISLSLLPFPYIPLLPMLPHAALSLTSSTYPPLTYPYLFLLRTPHCPKVSLHPLLYPLISPRFPYFLTFHIISPRSLPSFSTLHIISLSLHRLTFLSFPLPDTLTSRTCPLLISPTCPTFRP